MLTLEDAKTIGIIGGLVVSAIALLLNFFSTLRAVRSQRLTNLQEITKSHREIWKLTLGDSRNVYARIVNNEPSTTAAPLTYDEKCFVRLLLLHMVAVYEFSKSKQIRKAEKAGIDIGNFFAAPIPKEVWETEKRYYNDDFVGFVDKTASASN
jgi:hypothetical protein